MLAPWPRLEVPNRARGINRAEFVRRMAHTPLLGLYLVRPVPLHHILQEIERQRMDRAIGPARHGLGHAHCVEDRLFGCLRGGSEEVRHGVGREHVHVGELVVLANVIAG